GKVEVPEQTHMQQGKVMFYLIILKGCLKPEHSLSRYILQNQHANKYCRYENQRPFHICYITARIKI
ncbi:MAG: hypothetical protein PF495_21570, partial [Spirochaetales bacterium]|nr:hypothetical protein [Spirochaetales bacterium]